MSRAGLWPALAADPPHTGPTQQASGAIDVCGRRVMSLVSGQLPENVVEALNNAKLATKASQKV